jgi:hypothetical protein
MYVDVLGVDFLTLKFWKIKKRSPTTLSGSHMLHQEA